MDKTLFSIKVEATKRKVKRGIEKVGETVQGAAYWAIEHPVEALAIGTAVVSGLYKGGRLITRNREIRHEKYIADCRFYDPRMGEYVFSDRKLTNAEKIRFDDLYSSGMSKRKALTKMGRIKN